MLISWLVQVRQLFFCSPNSVSLNPGATILPASMSARDDQLVTVGHLDTTGRTAIFMSITSISHKDKN